MRSSMNGVTGFAPIQATGLVKRYGDLVAVDGIDLEVEPGTCLGLLGPNGAGKTTTIEMLEGLMAPDGGTIRILGQAWTGSGRAIRERIGVQLQETRLPDKLTVIEVLSLFRSFYPRGRPVEEVLEVIALSEKRTSRTVTLSGGQRQRLALGCALVGRPEILFLDEPTTGLDPQARRRVWEIVESFKGRGGTVLLTTHYMDEAERLSDRVVIIDHGKVIASGSPAEMIGSLEADSIVSFSVEGGGEPLDYRSLPGVRAVREDTGRTALTVTGVHSTLPALLDLLREEGRTLSDLQTHRPTLEDVFVSLTGRHLRDE
jgi:ABC-2 type transport system ATP-binding protein